MLKKIKIIFLASSLMILNMNIDASSASSNSYMSSILNNKLIAGALGISLAATCYFGYQWNQSNKKIKACTEDDSRENQKARSDFAKLQEYITAGKAINAQHWTTENPDFKKLHQGDSHAELWDDKGVDIRDFKMGLEGYEQNQTANNDLTSDKQFLKPYFTKIQKTNFSFREKQQRRTSLLNQVATGVSALALVGTGIYGYLKK